MTTPTAVPSARELAEASMTKMLGAARAQRLQLQTLAPGVGGPSSMSVTRQIEGLQLVETLLPALVLYARQLEGAMAALGHLTVTSSPDNVAASTAMRDALVAVTDTLRTGLASLTTEVHGWRTDPPAARLLELVLALQTAGAPTVAVAIPATAPTYIGVLVTVGTQSQAWKDGYTAGYRQAWADVLALIKARL